MADIKIPPGLQDPNLLAQKPTAAASPFPATESQYIDSLSGMIPKGPTETQAVGNHALDSGTQGLINKQVAQGAYNPNGGYSANDTANLMDGVGNAKGLLPSANGIKGGNALAMSSPDDFYTSLENRSKDAVAGTVESIRRADEFTAPMRQAKHQADASASLAKSEQLRYNNWVLKNQQYLIRKQLEGANDAAKKQALASILSGIGAAVGGVAGGIVGGPAGAAAGAAGGGALGGAAATA